MSELQQILSIFFESPTILLAVPLVLVVFLVFLMIMKRQTQVLSGPWLKTYGWPVHFPKLTQQKGGFSLTLQLLAVLFAIIAAARPQWGEEVGTSKSISMDVVIALDVSQSMRAEDLAPSRLERAKSAIQKLVLGLGPDRVALVAFAGTAFTVLPFTSDHGALSLFLSSMNTDSVSQQGTSIASVVDETLRIFGNHPIEGNEERLLVLFTDGEDQETKSTDALDRLIQIGVRTFAVGVGSLKGVPIPIRSPENMLLGYLKDSQGQIVTSRLGEALLKELALKGHGDYVVLTTGMEEVGRLLEAIKQLGRAERESHDRVQREEQYWRFLIIAIFLWSLQYVPRLFTRKETVPIIAAFFFGQHAFGFELRAYSENEKGRKAFDEKDYDSSLKHFLSATENTQDPSSKDRLLYNLGTTLENRGDFEGARQAFEKSAQSENPEIQAKSAFALGNIAAKKNDPDRALKHYSDSLQALSQMKSSAPWSEDLSNNIQKLLKPNPKKEDSKGQDDQKKSESKDGSEEKQAEGSEPKQNQDAKKESSEEKTADQEQNDEKGEEQSVSKKDPPKPNKPKASFESSELSAQDAQQILNALLESEKKALKDHMIREQGKSPKKRSKGKDW